MFWNCSVLRFIEIDIIMIYKCSVYMIETKFQMYFQKIYSFIKFRSLYTDFFQFTIEKYCIFLKILTFFAFLIPTYRCSLFRCFVSFLYKLSKYRKWCTVSKNVSNGNGTNFEKYPGYTHEPLILWIFFNIRFSFNCRLFFKNFWFLFIFRHWVV